MQKMVLECFFSEFGAFASRPMGTSQFRGSAASNNEYSKNFVTTCKHLKIFEPNVLQCNIENNPKPNIVISVIPSYKTL